MNLNELKFRTLTEREIDCRVGRVSDSGKSCTILLYKDARVDMALLDEVVKPGNWRRSHRLIGDRLYCTIGIWDGSQWIEKEDVGTESNTEKEKGQASDSFKRAAFNWGIGRELYSAPEIRIFLKSEEASLNKMGKYQLAYDVSFRVTRIGYNDKREISQLTIVDQDGVVRYTYEDGKGYSPYVDNGRQAPPPQPPAPKKEVIKATEHLPDFEGYQVWMDEIKKKVNACKTKEELTAIWQGKEYEGARKYYEFEDAVREKNKTFIQPTNQQLNQ